MLQIKHEASYLYDAVWLYALAADEIIREGGDVNDGPAIIERLKGRTYTSNYNIASLHTMFTDTLSSTLTPHIHTVTDNRLLLSMVVLPLLFLKLFFLFIAHLY